MANLTNKFAKFTDDNSVKIPSNNNYNASFVMSTRKSFEEGSKVLGCAASNIIGIQAAALDNKIVLDIFKGYKIDFESIIDFSIQGEKKLLALESLNNIKLAIEEMAKANVIFPAIISRRLSRDIREKVEFNDNSTLDQLATYVAMLVELMDSRILGEGSAKMGTRKTGLIDTIRPDYSCFAAEIPDFITTIANEIRGKYNRSVAIRMEDTKNLPVKERFEARKIDDLQEVVLKRLVRYSLTERKAIIRKWAYDIYRSEAYVHDSILFIESKSTGEILPGTLDLFIDVLADLGLAKHVSSFETFSVHKDGKVQVNTYLNKKIETKSQSLGDFSLEIKAWRPRSEGPVTIELINKSECLIEANVISIGDTKLQLNPGSTRVPDGVYTIETVTELIGKDGKAITSGVKLRIRKS